ncbi:hypothetical protein AB0939_20905 [Streptomyces sp. NPDC006990]|uniref:hypothetical protein n=1 Tax=unclassified Streptomyces TaxID=2593676 RepID=UPI0034567184
MSVLPGCADVDDAAPEKRTFAFDGRTLDVRTHGMPADLVATGRDDIEVTRWFDVGFGADPHSEWRLQGGRLDLEAGCEGFANCDTRFRVEVPKSVTVLRGGRATKLTGSGK